MNVPPNNPLPLAKVAALCGVALFMVPAIKGAPEAVQLTLLIGMVSVPAVKSAAEVTVSVAAVALPVRILAVTATGLSAGTEAVVVGLASAKLIVVGASTNSAGPQRSR